jgi:hypothetical protein
VLKKDFRSENKKAKNEFGDIERVVVVKRQRKRHRILNRIQKTQHVNVEKALLNDAPKPASFPLLQTLFLASL